MTHPAAVAVVVAGFPKPKPKPAAVVGGAAEVVACVVAVGGLAPNPNPDNADDVVVVAPVDAGVVRREPVKCKMCLG